MYEPRNFLPDIELLPCGAATLLVEHECVECGGTVYLPMVFMDDDDIYYLGLDSEDEEYFCSEDEGILMMNEQFMEQFYYFIFKE